MEEAQSLPEFGVITEEVANRRKKLFAKHVEPFFNMIYKLCIKYTFDKQYVDDNYNEVLTNIYRYIETYDNTKSIKTWLHIVTKRCVIDLDTRRSKSNNFSDDLDIDTYCEDMLSEEIISGNVMGMDNYRELYNDDILYALDELKPIHRDAILLQQAGYKLDEIADIEFQKGTLKTRNIETVKSRLFLARQCLQKVLTRDGKRKTD